MKMTVPAVTAIALSLGMTAASASDTAPVQVTRVGAQPSSAGGEQNFTGSVRVDSRFQASAPARVGGGVVTFEPGARTAWHTHPLGQTLIVTSGVGRVQKWGDAVQEIRPGDVVWIPPGVKHWHGASSTVGMSHVAISESLDGKSVDWLEKVSKEQYGQ
ncbi:quercetin dioxygenase-like cupin family protein [Acidovorax soli]|uniref:Quercetin dioxygenase-like cupin family protein n=1 Tax=Acidovorax soli TaxID=592050 RepID=A0A7X0U7H2_9BURK|nr:cupin domain-containing protein [Acidovorax soli]MBB6557475.1 quercetin dioxygenase-like cupin family protein [Acidovorax soli]